MERIRQYAGGEQATFHGSCLVQDAVVRNLQTLSESTQRLSEPLKNTEPDVPWRQIAGFRNVLTDGYLDIDLDAVWSAVERDLPALALAIKRRAQEIET